MELTVDKSADKNENRFSRFEPEIVAIKNRYGSLDDMRNTLGLSRREICKILMVDPSAWTRWTNVSTTEKSSDNAPAHVYKMLSLIMEQTAPEPKTETRPNSIAKPLPLPTENSSTTYQLEETLHNLRSEMRAEMNSQFETLKKSLNETSVLAFGWKLLLIVNIVLVLYVLFR